MKNSIFSKPKYKSHAYYDKQWNKLSREYKDWGLSSALNHKNRMEYVVRKIRATQELKRQAKAEGKECYCFPKNSEFYVPHEYCDYCTWRTEEDRLNTPG